METVLKRNIASVDGVCPYLGIPGDDQVHYGGPNGLNVCYALNEGWTAFKPVEPAHQERFCLIAQHQACQSFVGHMTAGRASADGRTVTYLEYFGLAEEPFSIVPQARFFCESDSQRAAHTRLSWLIGQQQGLGILFGSIGTGKTALCHTLYKELSDDPRHLPVLILTPTYTSEYGLLADLVAHWGLSPARQRSTQDLEAALHQFLAQAVLEQGQTPVLIVDEAQGLSRALLQQVRTLLNWQDGGRQLLQVVLAGQPDLQSRLARVPALVDRAVVIHCLAPMTLADTQRMIQQRLRHAGRKGDLFAPSAMRLIHEQAGGMPRQVVILSLLSLWLAYQEGTRFITAEGVQAAIDRARPGDLLALAGKAAARSAGKNGDGPFWLPRRLRGLGARLAKTAS